MMEAIRWEKKVTALAWAGRMLTVFKEVRVVRFEHGGITYPSRTAYLVVVRHSDEHPWESIASVKGYLPVKYQEMLDAEFGA